MKSKTQSAHSGALHSLSKLTPTIKLLAVHCTTLILLLLTAACSSTADLDTPPEIRYGEDVCDRCGMIINEARYAASYVTNTGEVRRFDDIGGMFAYTQEMPENVNVYWVHDYDTEEWIKGNEAHYVAADTLRTPMGFHIVALSTLERAESLASESGGTVHTFDSLMSLAASGEIKMSHQD
jgi:copper chaperone NosL